MSEPIITVEGLGKRYRLRHAANASGLLRDRLVAALRRPFRRSSQSSEEEFWALREVDFTIQRGDVVGIIGRNGAGKSTLLKILSRITEPTTGRVTIHGRVASLLEVGTGFHGELSGRENIFLNGAILGMTRAEIRRKFDEIVAFAEVEKFLDTPVKHYSSGMYVRLAFAVAAHLEPEILIVDEVLAVGDARFQEKCLGKIRSVAQSEGRTVLLVTHTLSVVMALCNRAIFLKNGRVEVDASPTAAAEAYLSGGIAHQFEREATPGRRCCIVSASVRARTDATPQVEVVVDIAAQRSEKIALEVKLHDALGQAIAFGSLGGFDPQTAVQVNPGRQTVVCRFPSELLSNGRYGISLKLAVPFIEALDEAVHCLSFEHELPPTGSSTHVLQQAWNAGAFILPLQRSV